jgi:hypothetical protein
MMAYLGGAPGRRRKILHDLPPGYTPPQPRPEDVQRQLRQEVTLLRVATITGILLVTALVVTCLVVIVTQL